MYVQLGAWNSTASERALHSGGDLRTAICHIPEIHAMDGLCFISDEAKYMHSALEFITLLTGKRPHATRFANALESEPRTTVVHVFDSLE